MRGIVLTSVSLFVCTTLLWLIARPSGPERSTDLPPAAQVLRSLHAAPPSVEAGDWIAGPGRHERGQTYEAWRDADPVRATGRRRTLYILRIGGVDPVHDSIVERTAEFLGRYYALPVAHLDAIEDVADWPSVATRDRGGARPQLNSRWILEHVLTPRLPEDGAALLALTDHDLWPGDDWNFVFGQASLQARVGVWSVARFGNPNAGREAYRRCLLRTLKVACHETGHMFSFAHCRAYACVMAGSNTMAETDRQPLWLCPECVSKAWDATGADPVERFRRLEAHCHDLGFPDESAFYRTSRKRLEDAGR